MPCDHEACGDCRRASVPLTLPMISLSVELALKVEQTMAEIRLQLPFVWISVRMAREMVSTELVDVPRDLHDSMVVSVGELVENAVKYGESLPTATKLGLQLSVHPTSIVLQVSNGLTNTTQRERLEQRIDEIARAPDPEQLYINRLHELPFASESGSKLGLYRVAFEGGCQLSTHFQDQVITVIATREIS